MSRKAADELLRTERAVTQKDASDGSRRKMQERFAQKATNHRMDGRSLRIGKVGFAASCRIAMQ